jgi:hypothetical protein
MALVLAAGFVVSSRLARLGADQHQAAVPVGGLGQPPVERSQEHPPFQQHHGRIVAPSDYTEAR